MTESDIEIRDKEMFRRAAKASPSFAVPAENCRPKSYRRICALVVVPFCLLLATGSAIAAHLNSNYYQSRALSAELKCDKLRMELLPFSGLSEAIQCAYVEVTQAKAGDVLQYDYRAMQAAAENVLMRNGFKVVPMSDNTKRKIWLFVEVSQIKHENIEWLASYALTVSVLVDAAISPTRISPCYTFQQLYVGYASEQSKYSDTMISCVEKLATQFCNEWMKEQQGM